MNISYDKEPTREARANLIDNLELLGIDRATASVISVEAYDKAAAAVRDLFYAVEIINFLKNFYITKEN